MTEETATTDTKSRAHYVLQGVKCLATLPALFLMGAFVGFTSLAREAGFSLGETVFMVPAIWAMPSHLVLVGGVLSGASLITIIVGVTLASVRLMPMVMVIMPEMRNPSTGRATLLFLSHFVAITVWVTARERFPSIPRDKRMALFAGFALSISATCTVLAAIVFHFSASMPPILAAALFFLTPLYFFTSLWASATVSADRFALVFGVVLGPVIYLVWPEADILIAGFVGGLAAFAIHRRKSRERASG